MADVKSKCRAIILVASGIDTFSKTNYDQIRRIIQESGVPIYVISTGNMFYKRYEMYLGPTDSLSGMPGRLTFLQAQNAMNTFALESGGQHFPMTFEGEVPGILNNINTMLRNQYSLAYELTDGHEPGKKYKIEVKVDIDGDGQYDNKTLVVQHNFPAHSQRIAISVSRACNAAFCSPVRLGPRTSITEPSGASATH